MRKIALTLALVMGVSIASYACQAAYDNLVYEIETFGHFDTWGELLVAYNDWVSVSC